MAVEKIDGEYINRSKLFYDDLKEFHEKTTDIVSLMKNFRFETENKVRLNYKYGSVRIKDNKFEENDFNLPEDYKKPMEEWCRGKTKDTIKIKDKILKLELDGGKIFLFKIFDNFESSGSFVMAGYIIDASPEFRLFLAKIAEEELIKSASLLLSAL
jgi:hypothetical protein